MPIPRGRKWEAPSAADRSGMRVCGWEGSCNSTSHCALVAHPPRTRPSCSMMERGDPSWPTPTSPAVSSVMRGNGGRDTSPERAVRSLLHRRGLRFRTRLTIRLGRGRWTRPDLAFTRCRVAVYIDGCFWHACPDHGTRPRSNSDYWSPKLARNVARDLDTNAGLAALGWTVVRAWEHDDPTEVADRVTQVVASRG